MVHVHFLNMMSVHQALILLHQIANAATFWVFYLTLLLKHLPCEAYEHDIKQSNLLNLSI